MHIALHYTIEATNEGVIILFSREKGLSESTHYIQNDKVHYIYVNHIQFTRPTLEHINTPSLDIKI